MSRSDKNTPDGTPVDAILRSLSNRPNVQYTLILSRKDGSIIKATGFKERAATSTATTQNLPDGSDAITTTEGNNERPSTSKSGETAASSMGLTASPSIADKLAQSIYTFVKTAEALANDMSASELVNESYNPVRPDQSGPSSDGDANLAPSGVEIDHQVQLLRMRTKKQEVIIFPDLNYLCCVVQMMGRSNYVDHGKV